MRWREVAVTLAVSGAMSCAPDASRRSDAPAPATHTVSMDAVSFAPATVSVNRGDSIAWINKDPFPHTATADGRFDSRALAPAASWTFVASAPGEIHYVCTLHPTMRGRIVVK
jgi:plastocyanin